MVVNEFFTKLTNRSVLIYGVGGDGTLVFHILEVNHITPEAFIVDEGYRFDENYRGVKIAFKNEISSFLEKKNTVILVAMNNNPNKVKLISNLKLEGFKAVIDLDRKLINDLLIFNCQNFFKKNKIETSKKYIDFFNCKNQRIKVINPFNLGEEYLSAFAYEMPDILMPEIDGTYCFFNEGKYEIENVLIEEGDVVIDCGANIGVFSAIAASKNATVYAFEPVPEIVKILEELTLNYKKMFIQSKALSNISGKIGFSVSLEDSTSNCMISLQSKNNHTFNESLCDNKIIEVESITIDQFVENERLEKVDFIKADIEGAERNMLEGALKTLAKFGPKISICTYHLPDDKTVLEKIILQANPNYIICHRWKKMYAYIPK